MGRAGGILFRGASCHVSEYTTQGQAAEKNRALAAVIKGACRFGGRGCWVVLARACRDTRSTSALRSGKEFCSIRRNVDRGAPASLEGVGGKEAGSSVAQIFA